MPTIRIEQTGAPSDGAFPAHLRFDDRAYPVTIRHPFDRDDDARLEWYYEQWLSFPFVGETRAAEAAASLRRYGQALFEQLFGDRAAYARYLRLVEDGLRDVTVAVSGDPDFAGLLWETLWDPEQAEPLCTQATLLRQNPRLPQIDLVPRQATTLNILLVVARPHFRHDVAYRTVSRPLVEAVERARLPVRIDLVRPGTWEALGRHLEQRPPGHYHILHFDLHGALLTAEQYRAYRKLLAGGAAPAGSPGGLPGHVPHLYAPWLPPDAGQFTGQQGFLFFAGHEPGQPVPASAAQVAALLQKHGVPICILNACQSAKQGSELPRPLGEGRGEGALAGADADPLPNPLPKGEGMAQPPRPLGEGRGEGALAGADIDPLPIPLPQGEGTATESSLAARLMDAGVQLALGMRYSVTVTAAARLMPAVYAALLDGAPPAEAVRRGRVELFNDKLRHGGFDQQRPLDDWPLPVLYRNRPVEALPIVGMDVAEQTAFYAARAARYRAPALPYGFVGRDVDVLAVEQSLLGQGGSNLLLVRGLGGAGKTALLRHLAEWWSATGLVGSTVVFNYDEKPHTLQQVLYAIGEALDGPAFRPLPNEAAERQRLLDRLKGNRHLLIFDNLESVTGSDLAIGHALPPAERDRLRDFLGALAGGQTLALLGSRSDEQWLRRDVPAVRLYDLPGLDAGAAADLAERVLKAANVLHYRSDPAHKPAFDRLMKLLDGHPLAIQAVLGGLGTQSPAEALAALEGGELGELPADQLAGKARNVLAGVHYAYSNVDPGAAALLACLAPFSGAVNAEWLPQYTTQLQAQPALADLPFGRWDEVLAAAGRWGLLEPHPAGGGYRRLQPIFPYFLRRRLADDPARAEAVEAAFVDHYNEIGGVLAEAIRSKDAQKRQLGLALTRVEYENLYGALSRALRRRVRFWGMFDALADYLDNSNDHCARATLCTEVLAAREGYSADQLVGDSSRHFYLVFERLATANLMLQEYDRAEKAYKEALEVISGLTGETEKWRGGARATINHLLGNVAQAQRQWASAEEYYRQALALFVKFNDRYSQATPLHQLGMVAQKQRQWAAAEGYYKEALAIYVEFNDRYSQATPLHHLGMVAEAQRQWAAAEGYYRQALALKVEFNDRYSQAGTLHQLGMVAQKQRQWAAAEGYYKQALKLAVEFGDRYHQALPFHQLGSVAQEQRQWASAEGYYRQALAIYVEFNDHYHQAGTLHQLGMVAEEQGQWASAEEYYRQALALKVEFNDRYNQANTLHQLGAVAQAQRQWAVAEEAYQQTLAISIEFNDRYSQASTLHNLGAVAGAQRQWAVAEGYYRQALAISIEFNDRYSQAKTLGQLGLLAGDQELWPAAADYLLQALVIARDFSNERSLSMILGILVRIWQNSGDATLLTHVAAALGWSEAEVVELFQKMNAG